MSPNTLKGSLHDLIEDHGWAEVLDRLSELAFSPCRAIETPTTDRYNRITGLLEQATALALEIEAIQQQREAA